MFTVKKLLYESCLSVVIAECSFYVSISVGHLCASPIAQKCAGMYLKKTPNSLSM